MQNADYDSLPAWLQVLIELEADPDVSTPGPGDVRLRSPVFKGPLWVPARTIARIRQPGDCCNAVAVLRLLREAGWPGGGEAVETGRRVGHA